jgi:hypothetical protein
VPCSTIVGSFVNTAPTPPSCQDPFFHQKCDFPGNPYRTGRFITVDLLNKKACFVKRRFNKKELI